MFAQNLTILIAFAAGLVSFLSPCILPIIPSFLSFLGGASAVDLAEKRTSRRTTFVRSIFFVAGFSAIFVALGALFSGGGLMLKGAQTTLYRIAGIVVVFFGLNVVFDFWKVLNIERRFHVSEKPRGKLDSALLGLAFGAGWTPCVGPILSSILFLAGTSGSVIRGIALLLAYSLGLGAPFLLAGMFFSFFVKQAQRLRPKMKAVKIASGVVLIALGMLIFLGSLARLNTVFFQMSGALDAWGRRNPAGPAILFGSLFLAFSGLIAGAYGKRLRRVRGHGRHSLRMLLLPVPFVALLAFLSFAVLSFTRVLDIPSLISSWLRFQGI